MARTIVPLAIVLAAAPALAQVRDPLPHSARLAYTAPQACPEEQVLWDLVGGQTTVKVLALDAKALLTVTVSRTGRLFEASVELRDGAGTVVWTRPFAPSSSCSDVLQNVALVVSEKLEPHAQIAPPAPAPSPEAEAPQVLSVAVPEPVPPQVARPPAPPKRAFRFVAGLDGIFTAFIAPSANAGFAVWAGIDLVDVPVSFEVDLRSTWSLAPAHIPLAYQPFFAVRTSYVSGVLAGCWRGPVSLCPVLEVGGMSYSRADALGKLGGSTTLVGTGVRGVYAQPIAGRFVLRGLIELDGLLRPFTISDYPGHSASTPGRLALAGGIGFGGSL
jgi:hypothetical protein